MKILTEPVILKRKQQMSSRLWYNNPKQLAELRDVEAKSLALIQEVCEGYDEQREDLIMKGKD